ncbi:hypothetical protein BJX62DRAFT_240955 [Aspergillus germanicus]
MAEQPTAAHNSGKMSEQGYDQLKRRERFVNDFHDCSNEAIGYRINCTNHPDICDRNRGSTPISLETADRDIRQAVPMIKQRVPNWRLLNQHQFDISRLQHGSPVSREAHQHAHGKGDIGAVGEMIPTMQTRGGMSGLINRRRDEHEWFTGPMPLTNGDGADASAHTDNGNDGPHVPPNLSNGPIPHSHPRASRISRDAEEENPQRIRHALNLFGAARNVYDCFAEGEYLLARINLIYLAASGVMLVGTGGVCTVTLMTPPDLGPRRIALSSAGLFPVAGGRL